MSAHLSKKGPKKTQKTCTRKCPKRLIFAPKKIKIDIIILVYEIKIVTNILMGFKCQVGGGGTQFSKLPYVREF